MPETWWIMLALGLWLLSSIGLGLFWWLKVDAPLTRISQQVIALMKALKERK